MCLSLWALPANIDLTKKAYKVEPLKLFASNAAASQNGEPIGTPTIWIYYKAFRYIFD